MTTTITKPPTRRRSFRRFVFVWMSLLLVASACASNDGDQLNTPTPEPAVDVVTDTSPTTTRFQNPMVGPGGAQDSSDTSNRYPTTGPGAEYPTTGPNQGHDHGNESTTTSVTVPGPDESGLVSELTPEIVASLESLSEATEPQLLPPDLPPETTAAPVVTVTTTEAPPTTATPSATTVTVGGKQFRLSVPLKPGVTILPDGRAMVADPNLDGDNNPATGEDVCTQDSGGIGCVSYYYADLGPEDLPPRANEFVLVDDPDTRIRRLARYPETTGIPTKQPVELQIGSWRPFPSDPLIEGLDSYQIVVGFKSLGSVATDADAYLVLICSVTPWDGNSGGYVGVANGLVSPVAAVKEPDGRYRLASGFGEWLSLGGPC